MRLLDSKYYQILLILSFVFTILWAGLFMRRGLNKLQTKAGSKEMVDTKPTTTPAQVYDYLQNCGETGREALISIYRFEDFIFPMAYGPFFFLAISWFFHRIYPKRKYLLWLAALPLLGTIFDYAENFSMITVIKSFPQHNSAITFVGVYTLIKWILLVPSTGLTFLGFVLFLRKRKRRKT